MRLPPDELEKINHYRCPMNMAIVFAGSIATIWKYKNGMKPIKGDDPRRVKAFCMDIYEYPNIKFELPTTHITVEKAKSLCKEKGKRLCKEDEWELACAGSEGAPYSYGDIFHPWRCNTNSVMPGNCGLISPAGSHPGCVNKFGIFDLNGNVSEWVDNKADGASVVRGGTAWRAEYGQSCFSRHTHIPQYEDAFCDDGFRCCKDPVYLGGETDPFDQ